MNASVLGEEVLLFEALEDVGGEGVEGWGVVEGESGKEGGWLGLREVDGLAVSSKGDGEGLEGREEAFFEDGGVELGVVVVGEFE